MTLQENPKSGYGLGNGTGVLRLTLLAPETLEAILDGRQPEGMRLEGLLEGFPVEWEEQRQDLFTLGV